MALTDYRRLVSVKCANWRILLRFWTETLHWRIWRISSDAFLRRVTMRTFSPGIYRDLRVSFLPGA
ncbi:MAG: hypothetical protein DMG08_05270 [Acidobacteria bacterium]|nr:MAG: hypothetical protein DMG08_05270 [Acidobacteriota bacterium]